MILLQFASVAMSKNVVVLGGGPYQHYLVRFLQDKKHSVYVVNPRPTETTQLATHIQADIVDVEGVYRAIKGLDPLFVASDQSDVASKPVAVLSERLGLPGNPPQVVDRFTHKGIMYAYAQSLGVPVLPFREVASLDEVVRFARDNEYPIILKPVDATNSRGLYKVTSDDELAELFPRSIGFSPSRRLIAQQYNHGVMQVTVEGICTGSRHTTITASRKGAYWAPGLTSSLTWPQPLSPELVACNDSFVERSGLLFGITHAEYILGPNGFWLNEIACRGGGFRISSDIAPWVSGLSFYEIFYENLMGRAVAPPRAPTRQRNALLTYYRRGELPEAAIEPIRALPRVLDLTRHAVLEYVANPDNMRDAYLIVLAEDQDEIESTLRAIEEICSRSS